MMRILGRLWPPSLALGAVLVLAACQDASLDVLGSGPSGRVQVDVDGPLSMLGAWRYYDGVRLLECDLQVEARAAGGSSSAVAEWLDGRVDLYDLHTGQYLASDYFYPGDMANLWGAREIESGERQTARALRYSSYGAYRAYFVFRYESSGQSLRTEHRVDCR